MAVSALYPNSLHLWKWRLNRCHFKGYAIIVCVCMRACMCAFRVTAFLRGYTFALIMRIRYLFLIFGDFFLSARSFKYLILSCWESVSFLQIAILRKSRTLYFKNPLIQYNLHNKLRFTHPAQESDVRHYYGCFSMTDFWIRVSLHSCNTCFPQFSATLWSSNQPI